MHISLGSPSHDLFLTCMMRNGLTQLVSHPTHGSNCIDFVLVSTPDLIWDISVVEPFSSSCDHSAIHFSVSYPVVISDRQNHCFLNFFNADYCSMISVMKDIDWSFLCQSSLSVEMLWSKISNVLHSSIDYRIQGLETVKITGFIRISPFRKLRTLASVLL